jgi:hypothetical protein
MSLILLAHCVSLVTLHLSSFKCINRWNWITGGIRFTTIRFITFIQHYVGLIYDASSGMTMSPDTVEESWTIQHNLCRGFRRGLAQMLCYSQVLLWIFKLLPFFFSSLLLFLGLTLETKFIIQILIILLPMLISFKLLTQNVVSLFWFCFNFYHFKDHGLNELLRVSECSDTF